MRNLIDIVEGRVIKAPESFMDVTGKKLFLAGSIAMGEASNWQLTVEQAYADLPVTILNPRRESWDSSWKQDIDNPKFKEQVDWEMDGLDAADVILLFFDPATEAPISLLELGLYHDHSNLVVCCPEGFWRRGNVQIVCDRFNIPLVETLDELIERGRDLLE